MTGAMQAHLGHLRRHARRNGRNCGRAMGLIFCDPSIAEKSGCAVLLETPLGECIAAQIEQPINAWHRAGTALSGKGRNRPINFLPRRGFASMQVIADDPIITNAEGFASKRRDRLPWLDLSAVRCAARGEAGHRRFDL
jgi:hypothetical protein